MKAVVMHEYGGPEKLKYEDWADPVAGEGELLVRVAASSVNPIDYKLRSGAYQKFWPLQLPAILGRDISGIVRSVGAKVTGFAPGDHVMALGNAAYAELAVVKAADAAKVPEGLDLVEAAALPLVTLTSGRWGGADGGLCGEEGGGGGVRGGAQEPAEGGGGVGSGRGDCSRR
jgi:NADPH:quinone reductase-like Zn-dependent oxidoreductase